MMCLIGGIFALGFAWQHRREREYLWFGVWLLFKAYFDGLASFGNFAAINIDFREISRAMAEAGGILASLAFYSHLLRGRKDWLFWLSAIAALTRPLPFTLAMLGVLTQTQVNTCNFATLLPSVAWIVILVIARAWRGIPDARLLLAPTLLQEGVIVAGIISFEAFALGLTHGSSSANRFITLTAASIRRCDLSVGHAGDSRGPIHPHATARRASCRGTAGSSHRATNSHTRRDPGNSRLHDPKLLHTCQ
jgi:hypothetical protein